MMNTLLQLATGAALGALIVLGMIGTGLIALLAFMWVDGAFRR